MNKVFLAKPKMSLSSLRTLLDMSIVTFGIVSMHIEFSMNVATE